MPSSLSPGPPPDPPSDGTAEVSERPRTVRLTYMTEPHLVCSWTGMEPDGEHSMGCDRPVCGYAANAAGERWYSCDEHITEAKRRSDGGEFVHVTPGSMREGQHREPLHESIV